MAFLSQNIGEQFEVESSTTFDDIPSQITLNLDGEITSSSEGVVTNAEVKSADGKLALFDPKNGFRKAIK
jgi:hypothetical protein